MTDSVLDFVRSYLNNSFVQEAASKLKESPDGITKALSAAVPTIFAGIEHKVSQDSSFMSTVLDKAKSIFTNGSSLKNLPNVLAQVPTDTAAPASGFVKSLFGNLVHHFTEKISTYAGIKQSSAHALLNASGVAALGGIGKDVVENKSTLSDVTNFFKQHRMAFLSALPASLGIGSLFSHIAYGTEHVAEHVASEVKTAYETEKKKSGNFLLPLILALIIIALILWVLMKTCNKGPAVATTTDTTVVAPAPVVRDTTTITLPSGEAIHAYKNGIEDQIVAFLNSPAYKTATEDSLKNVWFNFDNINFKTGTTQLDSSSYPQINNLIDILKQYPNAKVKFGAYTDSVGDPANNLKLSQQRANALRAAFAAVSAQITGAEGYGEQFAKYPASAPDSLRAKDRNMSLRFTK